MAMERMLIWVGIALLSFALSAIARHDWPRLTRASIRTRAVVVGHDTTREDGLTYYAARFAFSDGSHTLEVVDQRLVQQPLPAIGTELWLAYPAGRPDLARPARAVTWTMVYVALMSILGLLVFKLVNG